MEYWQDLYHELEQQKERGLNDGKRQGMVEGAQRAVIVSVFIYFGLLMFWFILRKEEKFETEYPFELIVHACHAFLVLACIFFFIRTLIQDHVLIGNLTLEEARREGTKYAYLKSMVLQHNRYQSIWITTIALFNAVFYWMFFILINLNLTNSLVDNELIVTGIMIALNVCLVISTAAWKR